MKVSDFIIDYIISIGTKDVFLVTGGAIAHIVDSLGKRKDSGDISYICVQHEQAGAMAVEAYSRLNSGIGVAMATSGPGATNLITGMCGCWFDSVPGLFITGQVNSSELCSAVDAKPRQIGFQETDIVTMVKSVTKFAEQIKDPAKIKYYLEKAVFLAKEGRPGSVLIDIPVDVQTAEIDASALIGFDPVLEGYIKKLQDSSDVIESKINDILNLIKKSERPVILLGGGLKLAKAEKEAITTIELLGFPTVVSWSGFDIIPHSHPQFVGHIGVYGHRGANFLIQNSDFLIALGSRLDTRQTGGNLNTFARTAKKVMVDIDSNEILKGRGLNIDIGVCADVKEFLTAFIPKISNIQKEDITSWIRRGIDWKEKYDIELTEKKSSDIIDAYSFVRSLSRIAGLDETIIVDEGGNLVWTMQSWQVKDGQRIFSTFGNSPMGYSLPAAIGASVALGKKPVICIDGDGGFQLNIQELQTIKHYNLPIKIFILDNRSMGIIKQFQDLNFDSRYYASSPEGGYSSPDFVAIAKAYGIEAFSIEKMEEVNEGIKKVLSFPGPIICDVLIDKGQKLNPKLKFGYPLEDMSPYLERDEFLNNMIIEPLPQSKEMPKSTGWQTFK